MAEAFYASRQSEMSFAKVYLEMMKAGYAYGFVFPSELMLHAKALTTAETLVFVLAPDARFERLSRPFIAREFARRTISLDLLKRRVSQLLPELLLLGELPPPEAVDTDWDRDASGEAIEAFRAQAERVLQVALEHGGLWQALLEPRIRSGLANTELHDRIEDVVAGVWERYYRLEPDIDIQPTFGAVFTTHAAALILALHQSLSDHGMSPQASYGVIHDIAWKVYTEMGEPPLLAAAAFTRDRRKRLKLATDLFRHFPFGSPSYEWRDVETTDGSVAFDCLKCPMAEFFARHGASELCVQTACKLDFPLAEKWGGRLERQSTLSAGARRCDFRWYPEKDGGSEAASPEVPPASRLGSTVEKA